MQHAASQSMAEYASRGMNAVSQISTEVCDRFLADLVNAYRGRRTVFVCGNGGSATNASHFCEDFGKSTIPADRLDDDLFPRLRVINLAESAPYLLAWANDTSFGRIFVEQLKNLAAPGDVLVAFSGSGNSENVLQAVAWAKRSGLRTWGWTGFDGGHLLDLAHDAIHVECDEMGLIESTHLLLLHWFLLRLAGLIKAEVQRGSVDSLTEQQARATIDS